MARGPLEIENLPGGWDPTPIPLEYSGGRQHIIGSGSPFWFSSVEQEILAIGFEVKLPTSLKLTLPGPRTVLVNGRAMSSYFVLFSKPGPPTDPIVPFTYPSVPAPFSSHVLPGSTVRPTLSRPNDYCPDWVHDLYVTPNRALGIDDEPNYFRT